MTRLLLVEDNRADARLFAELLIDVPERPFALTTVDTLAEAMLVAAGHDVVFLDLSLPDAHGLSTLTTLISAARSTPIVVLTGNDDERAAVEAVKAGAQDYLRKAEITPSLIARTAWYAIERRKAVEGAQRLALSDEAARRARFISGVTAAISSSLELDSMLRDVGRLMVPTLGDVCVIDLLQGDGRFERVAHGVADPAMEGTVRATYEYPPGPKNPSSPAMDAVRTRQTVVIDPLEVEALPEPTRALASVLGVRSIMTTPLVARTRVVGTVSLFIGTSGRRFDGDLRLLSEELAERLALGIENSQLYAAAQRAIRARDELLAVVSHDLRNPLGVVGLALGMLEDDPASLANALPRAKRGVDRMQRLIEDLLEVARIENGTLSVEPRTVELGTILEDAYEQHRPLALNKGIKLVRDYESPVGPVAVDRHRIVQAISNLLGNALKFTPAGGTIKIGAEPRGDRLAIAISDSGPGIAREHLDHIFDRFWQRERRADGIGLGLAIVKGIVDAHGGTVEVDSALGSGATFRIAVPRATATLGANVLPITTIAAR